MTTPTPDPSSLAAEIAPLSRERGLARLLGRLITLPLGGDTIAALIRSPTRIRPLTNWVTRVHGRLLQRTGGRMRRSWLFAAGQPVLALTTTGRRSGARRTTAVAGYCHEDELAIAGVNLGGARTPGWCHNLEAHPDAEITVNGRTIPITARRAHGDEQHELWLRWLVLQPAAQRLAQLAARDIPIFVLHRRP